MSNPMNNVNSANAYICPSCSTDNRENAKFCRSCGKARKMDFAGASSPQPAMDAVICHACSTEVRASDLFCLSCGAKQGQNIPKEKHCPSCNKQLPPAANFCTVCGTKVADTTVVAPRTTAVPNLEA